MVSLQMHPFISVVLVFSFVQPPTGSNVVIHALGNCIIAVWWEGFSFLLSSRIQDDIKDYLTSKGVEWEESTDLLDVASKCDFICQTRIQQERFGKRIDLYEAAHGKYIVDKEVLSLMPRHAVVMHPLPRLDEITLDVDSDPRAAYFRQVKNGLYIRMALLKLLLLG